MRVVFHVLLLIAAFAAVVHCTEPVVLQAHRMVQFDSTVFGEAASAALKRGSAKSAMRGTVTTDVRATGPSASVVVDAADLVGIDAEELLKSTAGGIVVVLPEGAMDADTADAFKRLEAAAVRTQTSGAVYAVPHSANVTALRALMAESHSVQIMATADAPTARTAKTSSQVVVLSAEAVKAPSKGRVVT